MKSLKYHWILVHIDSLGTPPRGNREELIPPFTRFIYWFGRAIFLLVFFSSLTGTAYFYLVSQRALIAKGVAEARQHLAEERVDSLSAALGHSHQREADLRSTVQQSAIAQDSLQGIEKKLREALSWVNDSLATTRKRYSELTQGYSMLADRYQADRQRWADSLNQARNALAYSKFAQQVAFYTPSEYRQELPLQGTVGASGPREQQAHQYASTSLFPDIPDWLKTWGKKDLQAFFASIILASCFALVWALWYMRRQQKSRFRPGKRPH